MGINTETLIKTVQAYPVLYDNSLNDYKNIRIKTQTWNNIAEILGKNDGAEVTGDTIKKQWKNLRDAYGKHLRSYNKTSTEKTSKLIDRYKSWPWAKPMSFLRPYLESAEAESNTQQNFEESCSSQSIDMPPTINADPESNDSFLSQQIDTPLIQRKRSFDRTQVNDFTSQNRDDDDIDLLFRSYAKKLKTMTKRRQASVKFKIAKLMLEAELEECNEMQSRLGSGLYNENNMVMIAELPASSPGSDTNDSTYVKSSPPSDFENVDPFSELPQPP